jgi:hypothetical protein
MWNYGVLAGKREMGEFFARNGKISAQKGLTQEQKT